MRYIWPLDTEAVAASLTKTSKLAVVYEAVEFGGWGAEVAAWVAEHRFDDLDAPMARSGRCARRSRSSQRLEDEVVPTTERIQAAAARHGRILRDRTWHALRSAGSGRSAARWRGC